MTQTATPRKQAMESQNSQRWMRYKRRRSLTSNKPTAEEITTAARAVFGKFFNKVGAKINRIAMAIAPVNASELRFGTSRFCHGCARSAAADRKTLKETGRRHLQRPSRSSPGSGPHMRQSWMPDCARARWCRQRNHRDGKRACQQWSNVPACIHGILKVGNP